MAYYKMPGREIALEADWDVIVAGGGPAGCAAATAAAREGAKTLLIEATGMLGGMGTAGLVPWFCGYHDREKIIARGLAERVLHGLADGMPHLKAALEANPLAQPAIAPELLKRIYDDMVTGAGVEVRLHSHICSVEMSGRDEVDAVIVADKSGLRACRARIFVDCTGDGDLAAWAGAAFEKGDESGAMQPGTHCFVICSIDEEALAKGPKVHYFDPESPIWKAMKSGKYPLIDDLHSCSIKIGPGVYGFNTGHLFGVDNTDPVGVSKAMMLGRKMAAQYRDAFAEYLPAFANSWLAATGSLMGARETRRILGDYMLTMEDYAERRSFPDEICRNAYGIDVHCSRETSRQMTQMSIEQLKQQNKKLTQKLSKGESFGVPYRCLTPKGLRNVLVAGRCISADRPVNGSVRIMACCLNTGEAAGIAAAHALGQDYNVHAVDAAQVREKLKAFGGYLPDAAANAGT